MAIKNIKKKKKQKKIYCQPYEKGFDQNCALLRHMAFEEE